MSDDHSLSTRERSEHWYPNMRVRGVDARPVFDISEFGSVEHLQEVGNEISAEILEVEQKITAEFGCDFADLSTGGRWENFNIKSGDEWNENAKKLLPITHEWLSSFPRLGELCFISRLPSGSTIKPHCGPWNIRANLHLGVTIPEECGISIAGHALKWEEGGWLAFDDSFEHHVWNDSSTTRLVLVVNAWHPDLTEAEISVFQSISNILVTCEEELV
ncbi:aspartyl/asparaginyl beta-hydroxylase domain-containing protein [Loktanella sp. SALINAS62]|uniref:aspartyl/asparaginyl beta-hydroxylase domain-containing protein n=1 Tax=Loktanella sp. SALINAS62 TaxID=2706124 RepID=UPI001B8C13B1|nr:aspartyl/asparaginyl beta-hydroxylase domain-containing protein [Loktanella sp. SALINAS62]MBS1301540.1 aspartyl/asparaginyl beta-hydroxylase domain-containing protein [Loktanella sp. SALINAS62]